MGSSSFLFFSADASDQTLHRRITPTEEQSDNQQERWNTLADYLRSDLKKKTGLSLRTWLQGSYKFGTQIRPTQKGDEFDIDLGIYFEWQGLCTKGFLDPAQIKTLVQSSLAEYDGDDVRKLVSPPKERCSRLSFEGHFHIDVPSYHLDPGRDSRSLATQTHGWGSSDPKALYLWFKNLFENPERARARRLIRYTKCWAALKFPEISSRPTSTLLTVLIAEAFCEISEEDRKSDDQALGAVLEVATTKLKSGLKVMNPVDNAECLSERLGNSDYQVFIKQLDEFRATATSAY